MARRRPPRPVDGGGFRLREKLIDTVLLVGIGLVTVAIGVTLFGGRPAPASPLPAVVSLVDTVKAGGLSIFPSARERDGRIDLQIDLEADRKAGAEADAGVSEPSQPLDRIAFSYVTGGVGACGVVLEPWRHVAVSRDLLDEHGCGATVTLTLDDEVAGRRRVQVRIGDTMNPVHERTVNIYVGRHEAAASYGVTSGSLLVAR